MLLQSPWPHARNAGTDACSITPLRQALSTQRIGIRAQLASLELDLGSLQSLEIGNVIPLPHSLDQPLNVISESGVLLCAAHLVQQHGMRALELSRLSDSNLH
jgi:flagellar motor switch protein FliM